MDNLHQAVVTSQSARFRKTVHAVSGVIKHFTVMSTTPLVA